MFPFAASHVTMRLFSADSKPVGNASVGPAVPTIIETRTYLEPLAGKCTLHRHLRVASGSAF